MSDHTKMAVKRTKGRPKRQDGDPGRDRLILAARELVRGGSGFDLVGKDLALAAGVTPALVRYYFQDKSSLIEAVARPLIEGYLGELRTLLRGANSVEERFRSLLKLLLTISINDGLLVESYVFYIKRNPDLGSDFLKASFIELSRFVQECEDNGFLRKSNKAVTSTVIWGACKVVGQTSELKGILAAEHATAATLVERQADLIMDLILDGLKRPSGCGPAYEVTTAIRA